ncbi:MAG: winged helix-turn-helix transcriptional regulator [Bacteroidales bacterium]
MSGDAEISFRQQWLEENERALTLGLLSEIETAEAATQRSVATRLGVALGLVNTYLKRCIRKGLIKIEQVPTKRYAYYLTGQGFAEKSRLVTEYLSYSLSFFRAARAEYGAIFETCLREGTSQVVLVGTGELAEIALLSARESGIALEAVFAPHGAMESFHGLPVFTDPAQVAGRVMVMADHVAPQASFDLVMAKASPCQVYAPPLMRLSAHRETAQ